MVKWGSCVCVVSLRISNDIWNLKWAPGESSVTRLGDFRKSSRTNFLTKIAQITDDILAIFDTHHLLSKTASSSSFGQL